MYPCEFCEEGTALRPIGPSWARGGDPSKWVCPTCLSKFAASSDTPTPRPEAPAPEPPPQAAPVECARNKPEPVDRGVRFAPGMLVVVKAWYSRIPMRWEVTGANEAGLVVCRQMDPHPKRPDEPLAEGVQFEPRAIRPL